MDFLWVNLIVLLIVMDDINVSLKLIIGGVIYYILKFNECFMK